MADTPYDAEWLEYDDDTRPSSARFERGTGCGPYDAPSDPPWHTPDVLNDEGLDRETL